MVKFIYTVYVVKDRGKWWVRKENHGLDTHWLGKIVVTLFKKKKKKAFLKCKLHGDRTRQYQEMMTESDRE